MAPSQKRRSLDPDRPLRVVTLGGGTGLAALLRALKPEAGRSKDPWNLTGIVTVTDNGGSSGRLRSELGGIPPGDLRNCLAALTREESVLSELLNYRFKGEGSLGGHALGNLMLLALADLTGDWVQAIRQLSSVLVTVGRLYPSTTVPVTLCAEDVAGHRYAGEMAVNACTARISRIWIEPEAPDPLPEAMLALLRADLILMAPGSLFTSTIPNLLIPDLREMLSQTQAPIVYVANLMTEPGESSGLSLEDHVQAIQAYGRVRLAGVLANTTPLSPQVRHRYDDEGGVELNPEGATCAGVPVHGHGLLDPEGLQARHHPTLLNQAIRELVTSL